MLPGWSLELLDQFFMLIPLLRVPTPCNGAKPEHAPTHGPRVIPASLGGLFAYPQRRQKFDLSAVPLSK